MLTVQKTSTALSWCWHLQIETEALADKRNHCGGSDVVSRRAFNAGRVSTGYVMYSSRGKKMVRTDISFVSLMVTMRDNGFCSLGISGRPAYNLVEWFINRSKV